MGLSKWLARKGAVGGTARWCAQLYPLFKAQNPNIADIEIYRLMIQHRFKFLPNKVQESQTLESLDLLYSQGRLDYNGLEKLAVLILSVETDFNGCSESTRQMFYDVIHEEVGKVNRAA